MTSTRPPPFIFFLDMDGVLNNPRVSYSRVETSHNMFGWIDPVSVSFVNTWAAHITKVYGDEVEIVLSSTWRSAHSDVWSLNMMFGVMGLEVWPHKDHRTRKTGMSIGGNTDIRGLQIADWLLDHPEVTKWMILDDSSDFLPYQLKRHIHTDAVDGILSKHHLQFLDLIPKIYAGEV